MSPNFFLKIYVSRKIKTKTKRTDSLTWNRLKSYLIFVLRCQWPWTSCQLLRVLSDLYFGSFLFLECMSACPRPFCVDDRCASIWIHLISFNFLLLFYILFLYCNAFTTLSLVSGGLCAQKHVFYLRPTHKHTVCICLSNVRGL